MLGHAEVHVPVAPERRAGRLAEEVAEDVRRPVTPRAKWHGLLAVQRRDDVVGPEREPGAGADRLLPTAGVDRPDDPTLPVEGHDPLLDESLQQHQRGRARAGSRAPGRAPRCRGPPPARELSSQGAPRAPRARAATDGRYASSSSGANGTGVSGGATSAGGASSSSNASRGDEREHLAGDAARRAATSWSTSESRRPLDRVEDRVGVERPDGAKVDHLDVEALCRPQGEVDARRVGDDGRVGAGTGDARPSDRRPVATGRVARRAARR